MYPNKMFFSVSHSSSCQRKSFSSSKTASICPFTIAYTSNISLDLAIIVDDPNAHRDPTPAELEELERRQAQDILEQQKSAEEKESAHTTSSKAMSEEAIRKRQQREMSKIGKAVPPQPLAPPPPAPHNIFIPASSSSLAWYAPQGHEYDSIAAAKAAGIWSYPSTPQERAKCGVFRSLWEQGYFMGSGIKFGGDYLVYPGTFVRRWRNRKTNS